MRPLSFTRNLGGLRKAYKAIQDGYAAGVTVKQFRERCGLGSDISLLVTEFFLGTQVHDGDEFILADALIAQTLNQPYSRLTARLYFFALNLNMPGERIKEEHLNPAEMQNTLMREHLFVGDGFLAARFNKDLVLEPVVRGFGGFRSADALRKWVNNYYHIAMQCDFVTTPDGGYETFPDTWGVLALRLFFERYTAVTPTSDVNELVSAAYARELNKLIGVPKSWLDERAAGAADIFLSDQGYMFLGSEEDDTERDAAKRGVEPPQPRGQAGRRKSFSQQLIRRGANLRFLHNVYAGECQLSGVKLLMPGGSFSVDCAHIRPLGDPHRGDDDVGNMLSLSPTMHRLFDRGCVRIDPETHTISLLHGNDLPHLPRLLLRGNHLIQKGNLSYHLSKILKQPRFP
ncbi:MAG: HNH endonuclease [Terracidiphilus sp.]